MKISRREFLGVAGCAGAAAMSVGVQAALIEPYWVEVKERGVALPGWKGLGGMRIAHVTDMHFEAGLPEAYAREVARRIREEIRPDLVAFTGDLTTHNAEYLEAGAAWLKSFEVPTVVCLGNHDYDPLTSVRVGASTALARKLGEMLEGSGVQLLRNASTAVEYRGAKGGETLFVAGVEDYYTGVLDARAATAGTPEGGPRLMLCHNPDAADVVDGFTEGGLVLSGHTHGGQIRLPGVGQLLFNTMNTARTDGLYRLKKSQLYVSRGVGYLLHARLLCRPEIVVHRVEI